MEPALMPDNCAELTEPENNSTDLLLPIPIKSPELTEKQRDLTAIENKSSNIYSCGVL